LWSVKSNESIKEKKMKKIFGIAVLLAVVASLAFGSVALADPPPPTVTTVTWSGGGSVGTTVTAGNDAHATFSTFGTSINGSFTATQANNPWCYMDTLDTNINAAVTNGWITTTFVRDDYPTDVSETGPAHYGGDSAGQFSYNFVGTGSFTPGGWVTGTGSGSLSMKSHTGTGGLYTNDSAFDANGAYTIISQLASSGQPGMPTSNWASFQAIGSGTADIDMHMNGDFSPYDNEIELGLGGGCYTRATATFTGSGTFQTQAVGSSNITTPFVPNSNPNLLAPGGWNINGNGSFGSVSFQTIATFVNGGTVGNFAIDVK
jgi:hypothetical protein